MDSSAIPFRSTRSELAVPIQVGGQVIGVLDLQSPRKGAFAQQHANRIEEIVSSAAQSIGDALLNRPRGRGSAHTLTSNPFDVARPISEPVRFVDRLSETTTILRAIERGENIAIVGERGIGKTSLLRHVLRQLIAPYLPVFIDMQTILLAQDFYRRVVQQLSTAISFELPEQQQVDSILTEGMLERCSSNGYKPVLLIDEFDALATREDLRAQLLGVLRNWGSSGLASLIVASSRDVRNLAASPSVSPFNIVRTLALANISSEAAHELVSIGNFTEEETKFIVQLANGVPRRIQLLGYLLLEAKKEAAGPVSLDRVRAEYQRQR